MKTLTLASREPGDFDLQAGARGLSFTEKAQRYLTSPGQLLALLRIGRSRSIEEAVSQSVRDQMEWEANTFAANALLPSALLQSIYSRYPVSFDTILHLRSLCGASIEVCANAYVRHHPDACVLLVARASPDEESGDTRVANERKTLSRKAVGTALSRIEKIQKFGPSHAVSRAVLTPHTTIPWTATIGGDARRFPCSTYYTTYAILTLMTVGDSP